ncbi:MAG: hypothetical protein A4E25_00432 [Methanobacterium sp. PtaB.Bin024]|nr:MAG: hypothetical protein A4E25_00432 [Methanobacterium sp. PtaB.Bin024]
MTSRSADGCISFKASLKSDFWMIIFFRVSFGISSSALISGNTRLRTRMAASLQSISRSAPTKPWVVSAISSRSTFSSRGMPLVWISSTSWRPSLSGTPISISRSNLPGRRSAVSRASGRLVAPITTTCPLVLRPSINVKSWATTRLSVSPDTSSLLGAMASISSMNTMDGAFSSASSKNSRSRSSEPPTYLLMISGPWMAMK